jgi:hypothetical protein
MILFCMSISVINIRYDLLYDFINSIDGKIAGELEKILIGLLDISSGAFDGEALDHALPALAAHFI